MRTMKIENFPPKIEHSRWEVNSRGGVKTVGKISLNKPIHQNALHSIYLGSVKVLHPHKFAEILFLHSLGGVCQIVVTDFTVPKRSTLDTSRSIDAPRRMAQNVNNRIVAATLFPARSYPWQKCASST